jgi:hypothetical protein
VAQTIIVYVSLCVEVGVLLVATYLSMSRHGGANLSRADWLVLGCLAAVPALAALPNVVRRCRQLPPAPPASNSEIMFFIKAGLVGSAIAFVGSSQGTWLWLMVLGILLPPLAAFFRTESSPGDAVDVSVRSVAIGATSLAVVGICMIVYVYIVTSKPPPDPDQLEQPTQAER